MDAKDYLETIIKQFKYYKSLGDKTFAQLNEDLLFWHSSATDNSIAIIVKHLYGNMLSRWTDFLTSDGEKEWRNRDSEFESGIENEVELIALWEDGWHCLLSSLESLSENDLNKSVYIRNMGQSVPSAINRQLAHYSYHVGQIVFLGKFLVGEKWKSLSIPKNESEIYNQEKFSTPKRDQHFTDEYLEKE